MERVLFVCTGNTCRSPIAAAFLKHLAAQRGLSIQASSAGLDIHDESLIPEAIEAANARGVDISSHKPHRLTPALVEETDRVFTMTEAQKRRVEKEFPSAKGKVSTLPEAVGIQGEIYDPYGKPLREYQNCAEQVWAAVSKLVDSLQRQVPAKAR